MAPLSGVKGMNDMLPADAPLWERFESAVKNVAQAYGYRQIRTPILEHTRLFTRGIGEVTDIVEKEMYSFTDRLNGEELTLRPENTASVVRAVIEHNLLYDGPKRLWYFGPMFRHERPQRGRLRQFHQFGVEAMGFAGPDVDAEVILIGQRLWDDLGLSNIRLELNTIGQPAERALHREALIAYFSQHEALLDADAKRRLQTNPLRILDTKNPAMQDLVNAAPKLIDYVGAESLAHFDGVQTLLRETGIAFTINPRLVRGLDYYNLTVFEWITDALGAQGTVCGGGRYDPLMAQMGGKPAPACGFGMGAERVIELLREQSTEDVDASSCDVYVVHQSAPAARVAMRVAEGLRTVGMDVILHSTADGQSASFKSQMKKADASGASFAVIIGEDELLANQATVKALRADDSTAGSIGGTQQRVDFDKLAEYLIDALVSDASL